MIASIELLTDIPVIIPVPVKLSSPELFPSGNKIKEIEEPAVNVCCGESVSS